MRRVKKLEEMEKKARQFMDGCDFVKTEERYFNEKRLRWKNGYVHFTGNNLPIRKLPYHCSLSRSLVNKFLFTVEIDSHTAAQGKRVMNHILKFAKDKQDFLCKYSGNRGFHMMFEIVHDDKCQRIMEKRGFADIFTFAKAILISIYEGIRYDDVRNPEGIRVTLAKHESDIDRRYAWLDIGVLNNNHMVRGVYSYHPKNKLYSIPVDPKWTIETILKNANFKNIENTFDIDTTIPQFAYYNWGQKNVWDYMPINKKAPEFDIDDINVSSIVVASMLEELKDNAPACIKIVLTTSKVPHTLRMYTTLFLKQAGYTMKQIMGFWHEILDDDKFDHISEDEWDAINMVYEKSYNVSCEKLLMLGLCQGKCEWYKKRIV